ncbi:YHS domain-containing (seleno)protein [Pedobacter sp. Hv1]|uniref:YHS domain-containing (seleno)protein n=1 Tax=Pedobacter sp. Hv1 TaxID=1740090 RepID=UPI0006D8D27C|nr:YHS domain-containing (seleno)protein [Pedobacter sp. Hv1]KQC00722.1 YHS domain protein [Pedobacter sp. Hv1]
MKKILVFLILSTFVITNGSAQTDLRKKQFNLDRSALAIEGYDPVAYFVNSKAIEGKKDINITIEGVKYHFSSVKNRELFKADPSKYEPQYGGWCAYAMGKNNEKVSVDPETFKILNGKLYLFYNKFFTNTLKDWNKDETNLKTKADQNWIKTNQ